MDVTLFLARMLLAAVFGFAGIAKLLDLKGARKAMTDFGAPDWLAAPLGYCLPFLEILVACLLAPARTAEWGAFGSLVLLVAFIAGIAVNMARGKQPDCHCFGQLHSEPIGVSTLLRNGFLAVVAAALLWLAPHHPGLSLSAAANMIFAGHTLVSVLVGGFVFALAAQGYLTLHLFRQNGRLLLRIEALESAPSSVAQSAALQHAGLAHGSPAPTFELPLARGGTSSLDRLLDMGRPILLVFSDAACGPCKALMPELDRWQRQHSEKLTFAMITRGVTKEKLASQPDLKYIFIQNDREVAQRYQALGTPSAVLVWKDGSVGSPLASGAEAIGRLVLAAASGNLPAAPVVRSAPRTMPKVLPVGTAAPQLTLPDLSEKPVSLADFKGQETMLVFWNPACGFCSRMLPVLKQWEGSRSRTAPRIVLISTGPPEQNRAMGLRSPVLLDQGQGAMGLFGASGTPSALLVDRAGNIASSVAVGADAIFALAGEQESTATDKTGVGFRRIQQQLT